MALNSKFIPAFSIEEVLVDKDTGLPLSGGVVTFYIDTQRNIKKNVYQLTGTSLNYSYTALPNPMTLAGDGTFQDSLGNPVVPYFYPFDAAGDVELYYVTVTSQAPALTPQFVREAVPYVSPALNPSSQFENTDNELLNPQFVEVLFNPLNPLVLSVSTSNQVSPIAPDWDIVTSGTGSVTIERVAITSTNTPTNPPYVLDIQSSGITSLKLRQRLSHSPRLMANQFVSGTFVAISQDSGSPVLTMSYVPSGGTLDSTTIIQDAVNNTGYSQLVGNLSIQGIINPDPATTGYVDILIDIPVGAHIRLSSLQIVGTSTQTDIQFDEQSTANQINGLFHYYRNSILILPKDSLLVGWDFGLNPWQFSSTAGTTLSTANAIYTADCTILYCQSGANNISFGQAGYFYGKGFEVTALTNTNRHAIIQYMPYQTIADQWGNNLSSLFTAQLKTIHSTNCRVKMRLIYRNTSIPVLSNVEPIASWAGSGDPVFAAGWTALTPINDPTYSLSTIARDSFAFDLFQLPVATSSTMYLGIVVYTIDQLDSSGTPDSIVYNKISLVPNTFAIECNSKTFDQTLSECQFTYEKSYDPGTLPGTALADSYLSQKQISLDGAAFAALAHAGMFGFPYKNIKARSSPVITYYSPNTGTSGELYAVLFKSGALDTAGDVALATYWTQETIGRTAAVYQSATNTALLTGTIGAGYTEAYVQFHYTINSNLGAF